MVDKEFAIKTKVKQVVLEIVVVDKIDKLDESNEIDKYREFALS